MLPATDHVAYLRSIHYSPRQLTGDLIDSYPPLGCPYHGDRAFVVIRLSEHLREVELSGNVFFVHHHAVRGVPLQVHIHRAQIHNDPYRTRRLATDLGDLSVARRHDRAQSFFGFLSCGNSIEKQKQREHECPRAEQQRASLHQKRHHAHDYRQGGRLLEQTRAGVEHGIEHRRRHLIYALYLELT